MKRRILRFTEAQLHQARLSTMGVHGVTAPVDAKFTDAIQDPGLALGLQFNL